MKAQLESRQSAAWPPERPSSSLAVLVSGGMDSAILLGEAVRAYPEVHPIYVRVGSYWESAELEHLDRFLTAIAGPNLRSLTVLDQPIRDVYGAHWSMTGRDVPDAASEDAAVYLPGRNLLLLVKPLLWCRLHCISELALAPLGTNPFPDATPEFFDGLAELLEKSVPGQSPIRVLRPYADLDLHKSDVLRRGASFPLEHTFSCINPRRGKHCGQCNKCAERAAGFESAGIKDPTRYAVSPRERTS